MHGLGQPCALAALFPPALLRVVAGSVAWREAAGRSSLRAAAWLLGGRQVQPGPAAHEQARSALALALAPGGRAPLRRLRFSCCPRLQSQQPFLLLVPLRRPAMEAAAACRPRPEAVLRATGGDPPAAGGGKGSLAAQKVGEGRRGRSAQKAGTAAEKSL